MNDSCWYALYTRHQHEKVVAQVLSAKGFSVFLPLYTAARQTRDRVKSVQLPLFPCYVFLQGGMDRRLDIVTTPGMHSFVESGGRAAVIAAAEIEAIRRVVDMNAQLEPHPFLRYGDWVRIKSGALAGIEGILVQKKNLFRLVLSVEMLGKSVSMEVDSFAVERVSNQVGVMAAGASSSSSLILQPPSRLPSR
jgi:transcription antitermination factor NusG